MKFLIRDLEVGVWCAVNANRVMRPLFFFETTNSERYVKFALLLLSGVLRGEYRM